MSKNLCCVISVLILILIVASSAGAQAVSDSTAPGVGPEIETFMSIGSATGGQITHDGSGIFFESSISGVDQAYKLLPSGWPYQLTVPTDGIDFFRISPTGE